MNQRDDGVELLVSLAQGRLELRMRVNQALDLVECVHDEHVDKVLARAVQPVVEGRGSFGELQVERVDALENFLRLVHAVAAGLGERAQPVPLVADLLTPSMRWVFKLADQA